jgi:hypothetical protein
VHDTTAMGCLKSVMGGLYEIEFVRESRCTLKRFIREEQGRMCTERRRAAQATARHRRPLDPRLRGVASRTIDRFGIHFHIGPNPNGEARNG